MMNELWDMSRRGHNRSEDYEDEEDRILLTINLKRLIL